MSFQDVLKLLEECYLYKPRSIGIPEQYYVDNVWCSLGGEALPIVLRRAVNGELPFRVSVNPRRENINIVPEIEVIHLDFDYEVEPELALEELLICARELLEEHNLNLYIVKTGKGGYIHIPLRVSSDEGLDLELAYKIAWEDIVYNLLRPTIRTLDKSACRLKELARLPYTKHEELKVTIQPIDVDGKTISLRDFKFIRMEMIKFGNPKLEDVVKRLVRVEMDRLRRLREQYVAELREGKTPKSLRKWEWIERVFTEPILLPDGRKRFLFYFGIPYLTLKTILQAKREGVSDKDLLNYVQDRVFNIVKAWVDKTREVYSGKSKIYDSWIRNEIKYCVEAWFEGKLRPWSLRKVEEKDPEFIELLRKHNVI